MLSRIRPFLSLNRVLFGLALLCLGLGLWQLGGAGLIKGKAWLTQHLLDRAWTATLAGSDPAGPGIRPWPWADTWPVARLHVPDLEVDLFVLAGASNRNLAFGPTEMEGLDGLNHSILSGHRDTHFAFLRHLEDGSRFRLQDRSGAWRDFAVRGRSIIDVRQEVIARPGQGRQLLTLVTCYPFDTVTPGGPLRLAVTAEAIELPTTATTDPMNGGETLGEKLLGQARPGNSS